MEYKNLMDWRTGPGICRCCLSEGCYKDVSSEYFWMGEKEVYADMLANTFGLVLSVHEGLPKGTSRLICEVCITRLRDAANFKNQVDRSEKQFVDFITTKGRVMEGSDVVSEIEVKPDVPVKRELADEVYQSDEEDFPIDSGGGLFDDDDSDDKPVAALKLEKEQTEVVETPEPKKKTKVKVTKRKASSKSTTEPATKKTKTAKASTSKADAAAKPKKGQGSFVISLAKDTASKSIKENALTIVEHSNVVPFRWRKSMYGCGYCEEQYYDVVALREHTRAHHLYQPDKKLVPNRETMLNIDITDAQCRHCEFLITDIEEFHIHLVSEHKVTYNSTENSGVLPFHLTNTIMECIKCTKKYHSFIKLYSHMNEHFALHVCFTCGKGFLSQQRLQKHFWSHENADGPITCPQCPKVFNSINTFHSHKRRYHTNNKRSVCPHCRERFREHADKVSHMIAVHNIQMQFQCSKCNEVFDHISKLLQHKRNEHAKIRFTCDLCSEEFKTIRMYKKHLMTHETTMDRINFGCGLCDARFEFRKDLTKHIKQEHD